VTSKALKKGAVKAKAVGDGAVTAKAIADGAVGNAKLAPNSVDGSKVANGSLSSADVGDYGLLGDSPVRVTATEAADLATARGAAPEIPLFKAGSIGIYAKCLRDTTAGEIQGEMYVRTSANGSMMEGTDDLPGTEGSTFLDTSTPETDRELDVEDAGVANSASYDEAEGLVTSAQGRAFHVLSSIGVKQGSPAGGNGPFGAGNVCLFGGAIFG
jgi:hypothetical protein